MKNLIKYLTLILLAILSGGIIGFELDPYVSTIAIVIVIVINVVVYFNISKYEKMIEELSRVSRNYIAKMTHSEFNTYLELIIMRCLVQVIREDISNPVQISMAERLKLIAPNLLVRYRNYFNDEIPTISKLYGGAYLDKYFDIYLDFIISNGTVDTLIKNTANEQEK